MSIRVSDAIQPSHPLSSPSSPAFSLYQHQGLFRWISSHHMAKGLEFQLQHQSFQWIFNWFPLGWTDLISLQSKGLSRVFSNTTVLEKHQFFGAQISLWSNSHLHMTTRKTVALTRWWTFVSKVTFLICNVLFRLVISFLSRSKRLLISWLQSPSAVIL